MYRFAQSYGAIIEKAPLQAYVSALIFSPACSLTRRLFTSKEPAWIFQKPRFERQWNRCLTTLTDLGGYPHSVTFSPDGRRIVSGSTGCCCKVWDAATGTEISRLSEMVKFKRYVGFQSVVFDKGSQFVTIKSTDHTVGTWDVETGTCISTCEGSEDHIEASFISPVNRRRATSCATGDILITDSANDAKVTTLQGHSGFVDAVDFSRDGRLIASGSNDSTVKIWDGVTGVEISTLYGHSGAVQAVCFSPDKSRLASVSTDKTIKIWDIENSAGTSTVRGHGSQRQPVDSVSLSLDGRRIASASQDGIVDIWDAENGDKIQTIDHGCKFSEVTFSPDGRSIAVETRNHAVVISDVESGATISTCSIPFHGPLAISIGGRRIAVGRGNDIDTRDAVDGRNALTLSGHSSDVESLAFSPKDRYILASASSDETIKIWDIGTGSNISTLHVGIDIRRLKFDPTGTYLHTDSLLSLRNSKWSSNSTTPQTELVLPQLRQDYYGVDVDGSWITCHGQNILWLPPEFRETNTYYQGTRDVLPQTIAIGGLLGRVWWITFSPEHHPFA